MTNIETLFCKGYCLDIDVSILFRITKQWCARAGLVRLAVHISPQWFRPDHAGAPGWLWYFESFCVCCSDFQNITWTELHFTMKNKEQFLKIISKHQWKQKTDAQRLWWDLEISAAPLDKYVDWEQMKDQRNRRQPERTDGCTGAWGRGRQQEAASSPSETCTQELKVPSEAAPDTCAGGEWVWAPGGRLWKSPWSPPGPLQGSPYTARWLEITGSRPKE